MTATNVLIVEDKFVVANNLQDRLQTMGYSILGIVPSGKEAIRLATELQPDIVLMDIRLPGEVDGIQAAQEIRSSCDVPIIYLTGHADEATLQRARLTEPYGYLLKPFNTLELHSTIEMALYRHAAERQVRESEEKYRTLVERSLQGILIFQGTPPRFVFANRPCVEICGYSLDGLLSLPPESLADLIHPGDRAKALERLEAILLDGSAAASDEIRFVRNDGSLRWLQYYASPIEHRGQPALQIALVDITRRKEAESALLAAHDELERRVEARTRDLALLNRVISATATGHDMHAILQTVCQELVQALDLSHAAAVLTDEKAARATVVAEFPVGFTQPVLLGRTFAFEDDPALTQILYQEAPRVVDPTKNDLQLGRLRELVCGDRPVSLLILPLVTEEAPVGGLSLCAQESRPFSDKEVELAWRVAEQVSGSLARAQLAEMRQRLSTAVEQSADATLILDNEDSISYVNPAFERATGYSQAEVLGRTPEFLESGWHEESFYQTLRETLAAGQVWQGRLINKRKDGGLFPTDATITPLRNSAGEVVNVVATLRDVTREIQLEEQVRHVQKMEAVGQLAGAIAHDFGNLLSVIHISGGLLEQQMHPEDPLLKYVQQIQSTTRRAANLSEQLLSFSRREIGKRQTLDLNQIIKDLDWMLKRLVGNDIELVKSLAPDLWSVQATPSQLEQVLVDLVVNARDAMLGRGTLTIETANTILDKAYAAQHPVARPGAHVVLTVSDTGAGMDDEVKARIFEPFYTTKQRGEGTGLGLATVSEIVDESGGHILVDSRVGQGTAFQIYLPSETAAVPPAEPEQPIISDIVGTSQAIVVVEGDRHLAVMDA